MAFKIMVFMAFMVFVAFQLSIRVVFLDFNYFKAL
jgi:hypothetical protein